MQIVKTVNIELTEEERDILQKAQDILMTFENFSSASDEEILQGMYEKHVDYYQHDFALSTTIDLLDVILKEDKGE
jgi:hypothetical protein